MLEGISAPTGVQVIHQVNDTLSLFYVVINSTFTSSVPQNEKSSIKIFPNPTKDILFIKEFDENIPYLIEVYTNNGKKIKTTKNARIDMSTWVNGIYYLRILINGKKEILRKVAKTR